MNKNDFKELPDSIFERAIPKFVLSISEEDLNSDMKRFEEIADEKSFGEFLYFISLIDRQSESYYLLTKVFMKLKEKLPEVTSIYKKAIDLTIHDNTELKSITEARQLYKKLLAQEK